MISQKPMLHSADLLIMKLAIIVIKNIKKMDITRKFNIF